MGEGIRIGGGGKKEGLYVWKKLTAEGGDFIDFVVSDSETDYPDGAVYADGYWYEKFQLDPTLLGYTKYAVDKFTSATKISDSVSSTTAYFPHSLGVIPSLIILLAKEYSIGSSARDYPCKDGYAICDGESTIYAVFRGYNSNNAVKQTSQNNWMAKDDSIGFRFPSGYYPYIPAGIEYTLITMV